MKCSFFRRIKRALGFGRPPKGKPCVVVTDNGYLLEISKLPTKKGAKMKRAEGLPKVKRINMNKVCNETTEMEGKKVRVNRAQVGEVARCLLTILAREDKLSVLELLNRKVYRGKLAVR